MKDMMNWEIPALVSFMLVFSLGVSFPNLDYNFTIDENGQRHYTLTPQVSFYDNPIDEYTNVLFTKYVNPWDVHSSFTILIVGIVDILLLLDSTRFYFGNNLRMLLQLKNFKENHFEYFDQRNPAQNQDQPLLLFLNQLNKKPKFFKSFYLKILVLFFTFLLLSPFYINQTSADVSTPAVISAENNIDDGTGSIVTGASPSLNDFSFTVGQNGLLVVAVVTRDDDSTPPTISNVQYGATSLNMVGSGNSANNLRIEVWTLQNPSTSGLDIDVTLTSITSADSDARTIIGAIYFTGAGGTVTSEVTASGTDAGGSGEPEVTITTTRANSLTFEVVGVDGTPNFINPGDSQTDRVDEVQSSAGSNEITVEVGTETKTTAAQHTQNWTIQGNGNDWNFVAVEVQGAFTITGSSTPAINSGASVSAAITGSSTPAINSGASAAITGSSTPGISSTSNIIQGTTILVSASTTSITTTEETPTIKIENTASSSLSTVTVKAAVNGKIDFSDADGVLITPGQDITISTQDPIPITIQIQSSTTITDADGNGETWNGIFQTANVESATTVTAPAGQVVGLVISIGSATNDLTLNTVMKITLSGQAGKTVFFEDSTGTQTKVTATCDSTDPETVTLGAGEDCKINDSTDLLVLTNHLTSLFTSSSIVKGGGLGGIDGTPPSFTTQFSDDEYSFVINGKNFMLSDYSNQIDTTTINTGDLIEIKILLYENRGPGNIDHVSLYTDFDEFNLDPTYSNTYISWYRSEKTFAHDPAGNLLHHSVDITEKGDKLEVTFKIIFAKPIGTNDIIIRTWDSTRNGFNPRIYDAWEIVGKEIVQSSNNESFLLVEPKAEPKLESESKTELPFVSDEEKSLVFDKWSGYHQESVSDSDMLDIFGLEGSQIPHWIKKFYGESIHKDQLNIENLGIALKFLSKNGILT